VEKMLSVRLVGSLMDLHTGNDFYIDLTKTLIARLDI
jgi:hypothetical protein